MTTALILTPNIEHADEFYELLINAHSELGVQDSQKFHAQLILLLSNHIGDLGVLRQALAIAQTV